MKSSSLPPNNIKTLAEKRGISARQLAKMIGTSAPHMSRLINGKSPLKTKWLTKISVALKVPVGKITGAEPEKRGAEKKFVEQPSARDNSMPGSIIGWLLDASDELKVDLSRQELSKLTSFIYKEAIETPLNANDTRYLAFMAVRIAQLIGK
jgi:transcriptional regulator with XRE-family HTH domain